jgi:hypothetical protein
MALAAEAATHVDAAKPEPVTRPQNLNAFTAKV